MSAVRNAISTAIRSRLALDLPGARDLSASPFAVAAGRLPAYAVKVEPVSSEIASMSAPGEFVCDDRVTVLAWAEGDQEAEANLWAFASEIFEILHREPADLGGLVLRMVPAGSEVQAHPAEKRVWLLQTAFDVRFVEAPAVQAGDLSAGSSLGFRARGVARDAPSGD